MTRPRVSLAGALVLAMSATSSGLVSAQSPDDLDRQAMEAYAQLDVSAARSALERAIAASAEAPRALRARLLLHRGIVALGGEGNRSAAMEDFTAALVLDPAAVVEAEFRTPDIDAVFQVARQRAAYQRSQPAPATPPRPPVVVPAPPADSPPPVSPEPAPHVEVPEAPTPGAVASAAMPANEPPPEEYAPLLEGEDEDGTFHERETIPKFFVHIGYGFGAALADANGRADGTVPYDPAYRPSTWNPTVNGPYAPPGYTEAEWANVLRAVYGGYVSGGAAPPGAVIVNDQACSAPSGEYCVRVRSSGLVSTGGFRVAVGGFVHPRVGVSGEVRIQSHAGLGVAPRVMTSARIHVRLTEPRVDGLRVDVFVGFGYGQMQLRPDQGRYVGPDLCEEGTVSVGQRCDDASVNPTPSIAYLRHGTGVHRPFIQTGPYSSQFGANLSYRWNRSFGLFARPVGYILVPRFTLAAELVVGTEIAF